MKPFDMRMLYRCLVEAEARVSDSGLPADVRERSSETVSLIEQRMAAEGLTRAQLKRGRR